MLKIYLVRHGQDEDNAKRILNGRRDKPLTELGMSQAQELADKIAKAGIVINKIYSSPLKRAYSTAEIVAEKLKVQKPKVLQNLIERDFGVMTGKHISQLKEFCSLDILETQKVTYFLKADGAESFPQLAGRGKKVLEEINKLHTDGNILFVTHGDIGKMIYAAYYNLGWEEVLKMFHFGNCEVFLLSKNITAEKARVFTAEQFNL